MIKDNSYYRLKTDVPKLLALHDINATYSALYFKYYRNGFLSKYLLKVDGRGTLVIKGSDLKKAIKENEFKAYAR